MLYPEKPEPQRRAEIIRSIESFKSAIESSQDFLDENTRQQLVAHLLAGLDKLNAIPNDDDCSMEERVKIAEELETMLQHMEQLIEKAKARKVLNMDVDNMNQEQLKAHLIHAQEQAETSMPSVLICLEDLFADIDKFDDLDENEQVSFRKTAKHWCEFIQKEPDAFEERIQDFRNTILVGDGTERNPKDTALIAYSTMYAIEFASSFCAIAAGVDLVEENDDPDTIQAIMSQILDTMSEKRNAALCYLQSIGLVSPQEAMVQLEWLKKKTIEKAKEAGMRFAEVEVDDVGGMISMTPKKADEVGDRPFFWKKKKKGDKDGS